MHKMGGYCVEIHICTRIQQKYVLFISKVFGLQSGMHDRRVFLLKFPRTRESLETKESARALDIRRGTQMDVCI